jgi:hypothetical protein
MLAGGGVVGGGGADALARAEAPTPRSIASVSVPDVVVLLDTGPDEGGGGGGAADGAGAIDHVQLSRTCTLVASD